MSLNFTLYQQTGSCYDKSYYNFLYIGDLDKYVENVRIKNPYSDKPEVFCSHALKPATEDFYQRLRCRPVPSGIGDYRSIPVDKNSPLFRSIRDALGLSPLRKVSNS